MFVPLKNNLLIALISNNIDCPEGHRKCTGIELIATFWSLKWLDLRTGWSSAALRIKVVFPLLHVLFLEQVES